MRVEPEQVRAFRLRSHHLDEKIPLDRLAEAAGACGLQNSPPGAWETAMLNRVEGCTLKALEDALVREKSLLQAWSFRGVPAVFPAGEGGVFLTPLIARADEQPWVYTRGITGALDHLGMDFDDLLARVMAAAAYLDSHTVVSKETLDQTLADLVLPDLPVDKKALWCGPSMYGRPDRQTVGGAAVSFLLRPCAFHALVVFGERQGQSPTFTSFKNWIGHPPAPMPGGEKELARRFLRCYGPATPGDFTSWLGCSPRQGKRLWNAVADELVTVEVAGKKRHLLAADADALNAAGCETEKLLLLGPHDPYLDLRDRETILADKARHKAVWQTVSNPGAVLKGGRVIGVWRVKTLKDKLEIAISTWEKTSAPEWKKLESLAGEYAAFRGLQLKACTLDEA